MRKGFRGAGVHSESTISAPARWPAALDTRILPVVSATPDIFAYHDYRAFLRDFYTARKELGRVSYRAFARRAGIGSPSYLKLVVDGERNLSEEMARRFAEACGLEDDAKAFFCELVRFEQAGSSAARGVAYARLRRYRRYRELHPVEVARDEYHSHWYLPAIREMVLRRDFRAEPGWIAAELVPAIKPAEAAHALETLIELGLVVRRDDGSLAQGSDELVTAEVPASLHLRNYHRQMIQRAAEALDAVPRDQRNISSVTVAVDEETAKRIDDAIEAFRRELLELSTLSGPPTRVVQVNVQLFPLTRDANEERP